MTTTTKTKQPKTKKLSRPYDHAAAVAGYERDILQRICESYLRMAEIGYSPDQKVSDGRTLAEEASRYADNFENNLNDTLPVFFGEDFNGTISLENSAAIVFTVEAVRYLRTNVESDYSTTIKLLEMAAEEFRNIPPADIWGL